ncbi:MAG: response regulator transcription factor [Anaerolineae bacterium]|nr:response regulator transcription factor [Anaerolineae bacterium]
MVNTSPIRVMLVDDHEMVRQGLRTSLQTFNDIELVGEASNGKEALLTYREFDPAVIVMDMVMPVMDGLLATQNILANNPEIKIIILTNYHDDNLVSAMQRAGIKKFLTKDVSIDELASAIRSQIKQSNSLPV